MGTHRGVDRDGRTLAVLLVATLLSLAACGGDSRATGGDRVGTKVAEKEQNAARPSCTVEGVPETVVATAVVDSASDLDLTSFDGTAIRIHWFPLAGATAENPAPTVLMGPGWGLAGDSNPDAVGLLGMVSIKSLRDAGFNVLTWDPRGFGASEGTAQVNEAAFEGRDVQLLLQWVSAQPGVRLDGPGDPRVGMVGASYGGGIQFVVAGMDCRVDAIVPILGWHSLGSSLFKAEVMKQGWAGLLNMVSARESVNPIVPDSYRAGLETGTVPDDLRDWFISRGPGDLVQKITAPTLIIQGTVDNLFTLDEGVANYHILRDGGVPVSMLWFCGGHGVCLTEPGDPEAVSDAAISWLRRYVAEDPDAVVVEGVDVLDQNGGRHAAGEFPDPTDSITATGSGTLDLVAGGGSGPNSTAPSSPDVVSGLAGPITPARAATAVELTAPFGRGALVLGAPTLELTYSGTAPDGERPTAVFAQLLDDATGLVLGNQVTPVPLVLDGMEHTTTIPLEMVAFDAVAGSSVTLQLVATTVAYAQPRLGGRVDLDVITLRLPVASGMQPK